MGRGDRKLPAVTPNALVASASLLNDRRIDNLPDPEKWQAEFWARYDDTPEVRFACGYLENAGTRVRLLAATRGNTGDEPAPVESGPAFDLMEQLAGGTDGQSQMMGDFFVHLTGPGKCYLAGEPSRAMGSTDAKPEAGPDTWQVLSQDELEIDQQRTRSGATRYKVKIGDGNQDYRPLADDALVCDVWRSHKRRKWKPDSPHRATLKVLRELNLMTAHVEASGLSRLAGAGILFIPNEVVFPVSEKNKDAEDPFVAELIDVMLTAIKNRDNASAVVPLVVRVPGDLVDKIQHVTFSTPFDAMAIELRGEAIRRYATGVDLPAEIVTGLGDSNHWTAWQISEDALKLHIEPMSEASCLGLTKGYLQPALRALGRPETEIRDTIVWYDTTQLKVRPDRSGDAKDVFDRLGITLEALRRETGFDESDKPLGEEAKMMMALHLIETVPTLADTLLPILFPGLEIAAQPPRITITEQGPNVNGDTPKSPTPNGPPNTQNDQPPAANGTQPAVAAGATPHATVPIVIEATSRDHAAEVVEAGLLAACDGLVLRALERAGGRLTNRGRAGGMTLGGEAETRHLAAPEELRVGAIDYVMEGAWSRVPIVAERYGIEPVALTATLDTYVRGLVLAGLPHEFARLAEVIGATTPA